MSRKDADYHLGLELFRYELAHSAAPLSSSTISRIVPLLRKPARRTRAVSGERQLEPAGGRHPPAGRRASSGRPW